MYKVELVNTKTQKVFERTYDIFEDLRKFLIKCKFSSKVKVISVMGLATQESIELSNIL